MNLNPMINQST